MKSHPSFEFIREQAIDALNITVGEFRHRNTGAVHYHLASDNPENVFLVGLRTVPMDDKGVAHILEHTALCGSEKYPVRDPFFMMIRRSLNTFMNAFTSNDWTAYPFASTNRKDYFNLLDVYLDAVFFSRLDQLDFLQEGHRVEFSEQGNTESELEYKGVVFNEMKGAMSSISSVLWQSLCKHLFPTTTYHYNSGGDPEAITDLSYEELKAFYQAHYHPSNAMFITFGDIAAETLQQEFEEKALASFDKSPNTIAVADEKRLNQPIKINEYYAFDSNESTENKTHIVTGWLLGQSANLEDLLNAQLLSYVLLENSASPLQYYLETTNLGAAPSPLCGLEDSYKELVFCAGIAGSEAENAEQFEQEILAIFSKIAEQGIEHKRLEAIVHQLELSQREISGDSYPYGLQLILNALTSVTHREDPIKLLDLEPVLAQLREDIKDPGFIKKLVKRFLLDNPHRVLLTMQPDTTLSAKKAADEKAKLSALKASLSDEEKNNIVTLTKALEERQAQVDDDSVLPKVGLEDVPADFYVAEGDVSDIADIEHHYYPQGTNGLTYQQWVYDLSNFEPSLLEQLPLYCQLLTEVGLGEQSFTEVQDLQSEHVGSISAFCSIRASVTSEQEAIAYFVISAKALNSKQAEMTALIQQTINTARFNEYSRIKDIVSQNRTRKENSITGNGHILAMTAATAKLSPQSQLNEQWAGFTGIEKIKALDNSLSDEQALKVLAEKLEAIHQQLQAMPLRILSVSDSDQQAAITKVLQQQQLQQNPAQETLQLPATREHEKVAWLCNSQINFCAKAFATVPSGHKDAAALTVLGGFLRNGFLHTAIREKGGAYGAGASQDNNNASFKFYSYRDPRITGTLNDFDAAIKWMLEKEHSPQALEEAILGVVSSLDKPSSPAGEAKHAFHNQLFGRDKTQRKTFRDNVLAVSLDDLKAVTKQYLMEKDYSVAIVSNEAARAEVEALGLMIKTL
jgi:Zn-dependent M16 (insulinase) family peptidase